METKIKHTPGPWITEGTFVGTKRQGPTIASCDSKSNAALIAAAPEMLEALEELRDDFDYSPAALQIIETAIKKAKGES